jgi:hypothetical protein
MAKDRARKYLRERIAHLAARLMAEDGLEDYATAKRKAARQAGVADSRHLPNNEEIDEALRDYHELFHADGQRERIRYLRDQAASIMRVLAQFEPHLTGPVLAGTAGKFAGISLQLFADSAKDVELFLINRRHAYRSRESRLYAGSEMKAVPVFIVDDAGTEVTLSVLATRDLRTTLKATPAGRPIERARLEAVEALLAN